MSEKKTRKSILSILCVIVLALSGAFLWQHYFANRPEEDENIDPFIISKNASVAVNRDGEYMYEDLTGKSIGEYQKIIPSSRFELQENECVVKMLENRFEKTTDTCFYKGYTYLMLSFGNTKDSINLESEPLLLNEEDKWELRYRFVVDKGSENEKSIFYLFQIPTDKEFELAPLSYLSEAEMSDPYIKYLYEKAVKEESTEIETPEIENIQEVGVDEE